MQPCLWAMRVFSRRRKRRCARDEMLAVGSHDIRSPLQSISMAANILACAPPADQQKKSIESISLEASHVDRLLQDLFDITRLESGRLSIHREATDVADLIDEARKLHELLAVVRSVNLHSEVADDIPAVAIDRSRMLQVLSNLLGNAIKFAPENGHVVLTGGYEDGKVRIAVRDDGPGIEEQHLERVFERLWKANRRKGHGAGLGLAIAKGIVESHGGVIRVESHTGKGSTFYVLLDSE